MKKYPFTVLLVFLYVLVFCQRQLPNANVIEGELIVQLQAKTSPKHFLQNLQQNYRQAATLKYAKTIAASLNMHLFTFEETAVSGELWIERLQTRPEVRAVQRNYVVDSRATFPDDPRFDTQWGLKRIQAPDVWDVTTGGLSANGDELVIAVLDSGFDVFHEDLLGNLWDNPNEIRDNGIDDDGNGYIDDMMGWDFEENSNEFGVTSHGTSVTGIVGAKGDNGVGVSGVNWNIKLMLFRTKRVDRIISAYEYAVEMRRRYNESGGQQGAFVVATNSSFGISEVFCEEQAAWGAMYDKLGEVGVLSAAGADNKNVDIDVVGDMPTSCSSDYLITVLNMTEEDTKASGSAFGKVAIDMGAPGQGSVTIAPNNEYNDSFGGNSAAVPHLAGGIGLLYSLPCETLATEAIQQPAETALMLKEILLKGVEPLESLSKQTVTGGVLNVFNAMLLLQDFCGGGSTGDLDIVSIFPNPSMEEVSILYETPDFEDYKLYIHNALGQLLYEETVQPIRFGSKHRKITVRDWPASVYFVTFQKGEEMVTKRFIKT